MSHGASLYIRKQEIEKMIREKKDLLMEAGAELSVFNSHADMGLELYEREKNQEIIELLEIELSRVNEALQKVAEGKYGFRGRRSMLRLRPSIHRHSAKHRRLRRSG
jgi:DnaK suppressor protein